LVNKIKKTLQTNIVVNDPYDTRLRGSNTACVIRIIHYNVCLKSFFVYLNICYCCFFRIFIFCKVV